MLMLIVGVAVLVVSVLVVVFEALPSLGREVMSGFILGLLGLFVAWVVIWH